MQPPEQIGPYVIIRKIGTGGMGDVFEARHGAIERRVAIKVLRKTDGQTADFNKRFINEARAVNIVEHPGIVQIFDHGQLPDGTSYIVMEYLHGVTLTTHMKSGLGRLPLEDILRISRQLASVLAAAHAKGIIHRDLKPDNVMLIPDPEPDDPWRLRLKLLDFGVAKVTSSTTGNLRENTQNSTLLGTPHYMAPEQCRQSNSATAKADVYSLGVIMYELLSGQVPFDSDSATDLMAKHMYEPVPPLQSLVPELPSQLVDIVDRMLQKEPAKRPTMEALTGLLESAATQFQGLRNSDAQRRQAILISANPGDTAPDHVPVGTMLVGSTDGTKPVRPTRLRQWLAATAVLSLLGLVLWWVLTPRKPLAHRPVEVGTQGPKSAASTTVEKPTPQPAVTDLVHFVLTTEPAGAQVIRTDTEELLGQTPWRGESARGAGTLVVRIQLPNYESKLIPFSRTKDSEQHEVLRALSPATPDNRVIAPSETETPAKTSTKRTKKGNRVRVRPQEPEVEE